MSAIMPDRERLHESHPQEAHPHESHSRHPHEDRAHSILHFHAHGPADPTLLTTEKGIWAVKWSFLGLMITALVQISIVWYSGSVALLADTIHNLGDATTTVPLWIAFLLARRPASKRFTYGYGRAEDLAGVAIVVVILFSAVVAGYESVDRFLHPSEVENLWAVVAASIIGFAGNELVSLFRIRVGKEINSAALVADGYHAQVDGLTSLAVLFGAIGVWLGYPQADPLIGFLITIAILGVVWHSGKAVFARLIDGVDPEAVGEIREVTFQVVGVAEVTEVRARWLGHRLHAEVNIAVGSDLTVEEGHIIANEVQHQLLHHLDYLSNVVIHVDPLDASGEGYHQINLHKNRKPKSEK